MACYSLQYSGLKVYMYFGFGSTCATLYQVYISRCSPKSLGAQQKMLGAQLKLLGAPTCIPKEKENLHIITLSSVFVFYFNPVFGVSTEAADLLFI